jgi:hypothetical protein
MAPHRRPVFRRADNSAKMRPLGKGQMIVLVRRALHASRDRAISKPTPRLPKMVDA